MKVRPAFQPDICVVEVSGWKAGRTLDLGCGKVRLFLSGSLNTNQSIKIAVNGRPEAVAGIERHILTKRLNLLAAR